jgi:hypothetical protein
MPNYEMVENVLRDWQKMDGDNETERKINSLLTSAYILGVNGPSDECLSETRYVLEHWLRESVEGEGELSLEVQNIEIAFYLANQFVSHLGVDPTDAQVRGCLPVVERINKLMAGGDWPDC